MARWLEPNSHALSPKRAQRARELRWKNRGRLWLSPATGPWGSDDWSSPGLTVLHEALTPSSGLSRSWCSVCFLARDPIAMEYYNWGRFQKPREGEAEEEEGCREEQQRSSARKSHSWGQRRLGLSLGGWWWWRAG